MHKRAAGEVHALRRLALPASTGLIETSGGQEDVQSFAWEAAENLRGGAATTPRPVTACELLAAYQASALSGPAAPPGCRDPARWLAGIVGPIDADRPFGEDIERIRRLSPTLRPPSTGSSAPPGPGPGPGVRAGI